jgi:protein gp37
MRRGGFTSKETMGKTSIEWTNHSANPIRARHKLTGKVGWHCVMYSSGCSNCYSQTLNHRFGTGLPYKHSSADGVDVFLDTKPLEKIRKLKTPQKVFLNDMTDTFADFVSDEWLDTIFAYMCVSWKHTFQILTKRADRMRKYLSDPQASERVRQRVVCTFDGYSQDAIMLNWPPRNVHLGVSCEDQKTADARIPVLLDTPASVRWVSAEPLLGPIDFHKKELLCKEWKKGATIGVYLDWIVTGGESGRGARPCNIGWIRSIVEQCKDTDCPVFVKQMGSNPCYDGFNEPQPFSLVDKKGGDWSEWPEDLRIREFPRVND